MRVRYDQKENEVEELKSITELRQRLEARRDIRELNRCLEKEEWREEVNLRDKLSKHRELAEMDKKWEDMQAKMEAMEKRVATEDAYVNLELLGSSPFTQEVDDTMPPKGFKLFTMESYDETTNLINHLDMFRTSMSIQREKDAIMCKAFSTTLKKVAKSWLSSLKPRSINIFKELGDISLNALLLFLYIWSFVIFYELIGLIMLHFMI